MFSGIVEEVGKISRVNDLLDSREFSINCVNILHDTKIGDSICVNGVCLTVAEMIEGTFRVDVIKETLDVTNLGLIKNNCEVNLERAMKYGSRVGGHFVQGHVDCTGEVVSIEKTSDWMEVEIKLEKNKKRYCIHKGSIGVDGVSLTIAKITNSGIKVALIPHTLENTILSSYKIGTSVNIEMDMVGKYIESFSGLSQ